MKFTLSFDCDNAAFDEDLNAAIAGILRELSDRIADRGCPMSGYIKDENGNGIGHWELAAT